VTTIQGTVQKGLGGAHKNLVTQLPLIAAQLPEIRDGCPGTLNLELDSSLIVIAGDHRTPLIKWHPDHALGEVFGLVRVDLEAFAGLKAVRAWLYVAHNSDHRRNLRMHEVIGPKVPVQVGSCCKFRIIRPCVTLPYRHLKMHVVIVRLLRKARIQVIRHDGGRVGHPLAVQVVAATAPRHPRRQEWL
jgi:hypothetical protein